MNLEHSRDGDFWMGVVLCGLAVILVWMALLTMAVILEHYDDPIEFHCDDISTLGVVTMNGDYVRDMTFTEKSRYCPKKDN